MGGRFTLNLTNRAQKSAIVPNCFVPVCGSILRLQHRGGELEADSNIRFCALMSLDNPWNRWDSVFFFARSPRGLQPRLLSISCWCKGCEDCYVPLLITKEPLERLTNTKGNAACVLIITYERDSIWHDDGFVSVLPGDIEAGPRTVRLNARKYRYQEISSREVLKLLQNPMGTIPISRPILQNATSPGPSLQELISAFKQRN